MITIMTTKNFLNAIDDAYAKGVCAGTMQQKLTDHEDQNRRLEDMLHKGKEIGMKEGLEEGFRKGYHQGFDDGAFDERCKIGEIDLPVVDDIGEALEEAEA